MTYSIIYNPETLDIVGSYETENLTPHYPGYETINLTAAQIAGLPWQELKSAPDSWKFELQPDGSFIPVKRTL